MIEGNGVICQTNHKKMRRTLCSRNGEDGEHCFVDDSLQESRSSPEFAFPDEILAMVFSHLPLPDRCRLSLVNKQWQRCAFQLLPKTVFSLTSSFRYFDVCIHDEWVSQIHYVDAEKTAARLKRFRNSRFGHLEFHLHSNTFSEEQLCSMAKMAKSANRVEVYSTTNDGRVPPSYKNKPLPLADFFSLCKVLGPHITRLHFSTAFDMTMFSVETFHDNLINLRKLKSIRLDVLTLLLPFRGKVPDDCFQQLEKVEIWDMHYDRSGMTASWRGFVDRFQNQLKKLIIKAREWMISHREEDLLSDVRRFVQLEYFCLYHNDYSNYTFRLFVPVLRELATACPRLTTLELSWGGRRVAPNAIKCLIMAIGKIRQLKTVILYLDLPLRRKCDEFWIIRMLREVAGANNYRRDFKILHVEASNWYPVLQVYGSMGLVLSNKPFRRCTPMELDVDGQQRCETYFI